MVTLDCQFKDHSSEMVTLTDQVAMVETVDQMVVVVDHMADQMEMALLLAASMEREMDILTVVLVVEPVVLVVEDTLDKEADLNNNNNSNNRYNKELNHVKDKQVPVLVVVTMEVLMEHLPMEELHEEDPMVDTLDLKVDLGLMALMAGQMGHQVVVMVDQMVPPMVELEPVVMEDKELMAH